MYRLINTDLYWMNTVNLRIKVYTLQQYNLTYVETLIIEYQLTVNDRIIGFDYIKCVISCTDR